MTAPAPERLTAALANRYRIEEKLGEGGMASVYLAEDLKHDRKVAIKVLRPELAAVTFTWVLNWPEIVRGTGGVGR